VDNPANHEYPLPLTAAGLDNCQVGRLRQGLRVRERALFLGRGRSLLKGAALNAVQIAEVLLR